MKGKILTMKIIYKDESDGKAVINAIKHYSRSMAKLKRCEVVYTTVETRIEVKE